MQQINDEYEKLHKTIIWNKRNWNARKKDKKDEYKNLVTHFLVEILHLGDKIWLEAHYMIEEITMITHQDSLW